MRTPVSRSQADHSRDTVPSYQDCARLALPAVPNRHGSGIPRDRPKTFRGRSVRKPAAQRISSPMSTKRRESAKTQGKGPSGLWICKCGCGREAKPPRRYWFSDECVRNWKIRNDPGTVRRLVFERDGGICAMCCVNTEEQRAKAIPLLRQSGFPGWVRRYRKTLWNADHILPVVRGGGQCGLDNYRTLCVTCHKRETAKLAKERAQERKANPAQINRLTD